MQAAAAFAAPAKLRRSEMTFCQTNASRGGQNIERPTFNIERFARRGLIAYSVLDVGCWMFLVSTLRRQINRFGNARPRAQGSADVHICGLTGHPCPVFPEKATQSRLPPRLESPR